MGINKVKRLVAVLILLTVLLALPIFEDVYHTTLYYAGAIILIPITIFRIVWDEKFEHRFYRRWHKAREQGYWVNVFREGLRSFVHIILVICISQFLGNSYTPLKIVSKLSGGVLACLLLFIIVFYCFLLFFIGLSLIIGIVAWHENEKGYYRIHYNKVSSISGKG
ncbi:hypothetical protein [Desulfolucanica intricata]|uniref:hypothetical protein n=1 Tax=Desulfolucanica intricata TaxID=1285191 RepID=UPI000832CFE4|nr:hypothetical protein [Desulfolucanica intricata]